jgi:hypothetical protein
MAVRLAANSYSDLCDRIGGEVEVVREKHYKTFERIDDEAGFGTIAQIQEWMHKNGVPDYAVVVYDGCGTHNIGFEWTTVKEPEAIDEYR